jgi:heat shock protein HtpX
MVFSILASIIVAWFSRQREFRADAGSANLLGTPRPMVNALKRLAGMERCSLPDSIATHGIRIGPAGWRCFLRIHRWSNASRR